MRTFISFLFFLIFSANIFAISTINPFISSDGSTKPLDMAYFLIKKNPKINFNLAYVISCLYTKESLKENINYDIAFSQMLLETNFLNFNGSVASSQNNFAGLGVTGNFNSGLSFNNLDKGIKAQIQHLKAYATTQKLNGNLVDPRFNYVKRGSALTIYQLSGKWATDKNYGKKLAHILTQLLNQKKEDTLYVKN